MPGEVTAGVPLRTNPKLFGVDLLLINGHAQELIAVVLLLLGGYMTVSGLVRRL